MADQIVRIPLYMRVLDGAVALLLAVFIFIPAMALHRFGQSRRLAPLQRGTARVLRLLQQTTPN